MPYSHYDETHICLDFFGCCGWWCARMLRLGHGEFCTRQVGHASAAERGAHARGMEAHE